jgi:muramoyltetrapeptide carboxypeptidase
VSPRRAEFPPAVPKGARIAVVAPGSPVPAQALRAGLAKISSWGYRPEPSRHARARLGDLAGGDRERAADLTAALEDPGIGAVWCARGGWGAARLLEHLDLPRLAASGRPLIGFSDVTALLLALWPHGGVGWHAPLVADLARPERFVEADLRWMLARPGERRQFRPGRRRRFVAGRARGPLVGGCLSVLAALTGTRHQPDLQGALLFLEEIGEAPYRIDRMLWQLWEGGVMQGVRGLAFGQFTGCRHPRGRPTRKLSEVLREHAERLGRPALGGLPFGHGRKARAVPFGVEAELDADAGELRIPRSV